MKELSRVIDARVLWLGSARYWTCQLFGWGGVAAFGLLVVLLVSQREIAVGIDSALAQSEQSLSSQERIGDARLMALTCAAGLLASHLWRVVILAQGWISWPLLKLIAICLVWWVGLSLLFAAVGVRFFSTNLPGKDPATNVIACIMMNGTLYGAWCALYFLVHYYDAYHLSNLERAELAAAGVASQLMVLQGQTNPHFLFNSLNTIRALMPPTATEARQAITLLADLLRATLEEGKKPSIPLRRELEIVRVYLSLEQLRFQEDLVVEEEIEPGTLETPVPSLMLQMLVENAIKHGLLANGGRGVIRLSTEQTPEALLLRVCSPGKLQEAKGETSISLGIGLENVRERLRLLFGDAADLSLRAPQSGLIEVLVRIPHQRALT